MNRPHLFVLAIILLLPAVPTYAYLDPASGSMFLQLLLGGVAGIALAVKLYWHKLLRFLGIKKEQDDQPSV